MIQIDSHWSTYLYSWKHGKKISHAQYWQLPRFRIFMHNSTCILSCLHPFFPLPPLPLQISICYVTIQPVVFSTFTPYANPKMALLYCAGKLYLQKTFLAIHTHTYIRYICACIPINDSFAYSHIPYHCYSEICIDLKYICLTFVDKIQLK